MDRQANNKSLQEILDEIIDEKGIRFAGFINRKGDLVIGKFCKDVIPFESDNEQKKILENWQ